MVVRRTAGRMNQVLIEVWANVRNIQSQEVQAVQSDCTALKACLVEVDFVVQVQHKEDCETAVGPRSRLVDEAESSRGVRRDPACLEETAEADDRTVRPVQIPTAVVGRVESGGVAAWSAMGLVEQRARLGCV